jgi:SAM-dependent methyltransferase
MKTLLKRIWYWGRKHHCNVCLAHVRTWIWVGLSSEVFNNHEMVGAGRRKRGCPICHATDRDRLMLHFFENHWNNLFENSKPDVLHFAPESYLIGFLNAHTKRYVKGDFFAPGYQYTSDTLQMDVQQITFENNTWDMVIANHVLEHVKDDNLAMSEIFRVLKPGGVAIVQVPWSLNLSDTIEVSDVENPLNLESITGQFDHQRLYGLDFYKRLMDVGFELEYWSDANQIQRLGLHPREQIVMARKATK